MEALLLAIEHAANEPLVQGVLAALATLVLEDPATVGCGLLVARGHMLFSTAFAGLFLGIALGDLGLYGLGRLIRSGRLHERVLPSGIVDSGRLESAGDLFRRNAVQALLLSRFVPGMRLPTYVGAGMARLSPALFLAVIVPASLAWTLLLLWAVNLFGEKVLGHLGPVQYGLAGAVLVLLLVLRSRSALKSPPGAVRHFSIFELWPAWLFYAPMVPWWAWLSLRYGGVLTPTAANPSIYWSGLIMESKSEILRLIPEDEPVARWMLCTAPRDTDEEGSLEDHLSGLLERLREQDLSFPLVAKPDRGQRGAGVRPVRDRDELAAYMRAFPAGREFLLQEMVDREGDGGVFYWRMPGAERGEVPSLTLREKPGVVGDGKRSLRELILADPRAGRISKVYFQRFKDRLDTIPGEGERIPLVFSGNHCQGAVFLNGNDHITDMLAERFDRLAGRIPGFYFGRFDIRFTSLEDLEQGKGFMIVELNGASAESTHIWDARTSLWRAWRDLFRQFHMLFRIGAANRKAGHPTQPASSFLKDVRAYRRLAAGYPRTL